VIQIATELEQRVRRCCNLNQVATGQSGESELVVKQQPAECRSEKCSLLLSGLVMTAGGAVVWSATIAIARGAEFRNRTRNGYRRFLRDA
jgi:hypothetical protein